jgi:hypothetical protein
VQHAETVEILVFGDQQKAMFDCGLPDGEVRGTGQAEIFDVQRVGLSIREKARQTTGQLLVEEQPHVDLRGGDADRTTLAFLGVRQARADVVA